MSVSDFAITQLHGQVGTLTRINLHNLRQRQPDLIPIHDRVLRLQRIPLQIHRPQLFLVPQLPLHLLKRFERIARGPQFLEMTQMAEIGQVRDLIV